MAAMSLWEAMAKVTEERNEENTQLQCGLMMLNCEWEVAHYKGKL